MIAGVRHTGIVVKNLEATRDFYLALGFTIQSQAQETGSFIEQVTGLAKVKLQWVKMSLPDYSLLELIRYDFPMDIETDGLQNPNRLGVSHLAFSVREIDKFCGLVVELGGNVINAPALTKEKNYKVAYCHDIEGNLFEAVEIQ